MPSATSEHAMPLDTSLIVPSPPPATTMPAPSDRARALADAGLTFADIDAVGDHELFGSTEGNEVKRAGLRATAATLVKRVGEDDPKELADTNDRGEKRRSGRRGEDRIAFELDDRELGLHALADRTE